MLSPQLSSNARCGRTNKFMRLFIAVNFSDTVKNQLLALCEELSSRSERGRFSLPENLIFPAGNIGSMQTARRLPLQRLSGRLCRGQVAGLPDHRTAFLRRAMPATQRATPALVIKMGLSTGRIVPSAGAAGNDCAPQTPSLRGAVGTNSSDCVLWTCLTGCR
jgi:hypothetical protein